MRIEDELEFGRRRRTGLAINIVPLVDVVFLLLIFFMLANSFLDQEAIELRLPAAQSTTVPSETAALVDIAPDGSLRLDGVGLDLAALARAIEHRLAADPAVTVALRTAREVAVRRVVEVMDRLRLAGAGNLRILADEGEGVER